MTDRPTQPPDGPAEDRSRALLDGLVRSMSDGVLLADADLRVVEYAGGAERIYGWARQEALGRSLATGFRSEFPDGDAAEVRRRLAAGEAVRCRMRAQRKDGSWADLDLSATPLRDPAGALTGWLSVARDIGPQVAAEAAQRALLAQVTESERRLAFVLQGSRDGFWDWDVPSGAVRFSDRWATMLGYRPEALEPHVRTWERLVHPLDRPRVNDLVGQLLDGRLAHYECEHRMRRADGAWAWVLDRGTVVARDAAGRALRAAGTHTDVTARKEAEEALQAAHADNQRLVQELRAALHDVRTLTGFIPICSECKRVRDDEGYWERIEEFLAQRTSAEPTPGLCPDCAGRGAPGR